MLKIPEGVFNMSFNTSTLGYKLVSGVLKKNRVHSEQLNKYVAGLFDADGYIGFEFVTDLLYLRAGITVSASVDEDFRTLRALHQFYNLGTLMYHYQDNGVSNCSWRISTKDCQTFYNRVGKHMRIKQTHFHNLLEEQKRWKLIKIECKDTQRKLKEFSKYSRSTSSWFKRPKHLSFAWVAGYLDGDGCYRIRRKSGTIRTLSVKAASHDLFILGKLQEDFGGSINTQAKDDETIKCWRRGLGIGNIKFSLPFLYNMRKFSCIENKYRKIQEMITHLENSASRKD